MSLTGPQSSEQFFRAIATRLQRLEWRPTYVPVAPLTALSTAMPDPGLLPVGTIVFATDLSKPFWSDGESWIAADGTALP